MGTQFQKILNIRGVTHQALATELGVTRQSVSFWAKRGAPPVKHLIRIAEMLKVSPGQLAGAEPFLTREEELSQKRFIEARDGWQLICAQSRTDPEAGETAVSALELSDAFLRRLTGLGEIDPEQFDIIAVQSDSMEPTIQRNGFCLVDRNLKQITGDGIYLVRMPGGSFVKRVQCELDGSCTYLSDNPKYLPRRIPRFSPEEAEAAVLGRVICIFNALPC